MMIMAKRATHVSETRKHLTKAEKKARSKAEKKLQGDSDNIVPDEPLTEAQLDIFKKTTSELLERGIASNLDAPVITQYSRCYDRLNQIERYLDENKDALFDNKLMTIQDKVYKQYIKYCSELCLTPQSRAKMSTTATPNEEVDPLASLLSDFDG